MLIMEYRQKDIPSMDIITILIIITIIPAVVPAVVAFE